MAIWLGICIGILVASLPLYGLVAYCAVIAIEEFEEERKNKKNDVADIDL